MASRRIRLMGLAATSVPQGACSAIVSCHELSRKLWKRADSMRLDIYVTDHCENCQEALRLAALVGEEPGVEVRVINLDTTTEPIPARVVATPTYLLDGRLVAFGNPRADELLHLLRKGAATSDERGERVGPAGPLGSRRRHEEAGA